MRLVSTARNFQRLFPCVLVLALGSSNAVDAAVLYGLVRNPPTTAGVPLSTRSGAGSWHLYALEDASQNDLGIASYNVTLSGTTAINHRSPVGTATDSNGDAQNWGFSLLRSGTNTNPIVASQSLSGMTPFIITGLGRTAGSASSQILAADPGATSIFATSGATWGNYSFYDTFLMSPFEQSSGHKSVFLAEGLGSLPQIVSAATTVLSNANGLQIAAASLIVSPQDDPEPATICLLALAVTAVLSQRHRF